MPTYCFTVPDTGETVEREYPLGKAPPKIRLRNRRTAHRDYRAERAQGLVKNETASRRGRGKSCWPMAPCYASGVHASQAGELREHLRKRGCPTEVTPDGDPIYTSKEHRRKALKARGLHDRNSFD